MISGLFDALFGGFFDLVKEVFAFVIYWGGWFVIIPLGIFALYKFIPKLADNIIIRDWVFIIIQGLLVILIVVMTWKLFVGFTNAGKELDPNRPTGIEKAIQDVGKD